MFPFKKILCPTDFSEASHCGIKMAREMALQLDSEIILLNVHKPIPQLPTPRMQATDITFDVSAYEKEIIADAEVSLKELADQLLGEDVKTKLLVHMGTPSKEILQVAEDEEVDAIFIATHGRTGLSRIFFGSTAQRVVRRAPCPVLTIRACE
jgi:nucleotide-binding universal stress UspA family protein